VAEYTPALAAQDTLAVAAEYILAAAAAAAAAAAPPAPAVPAPSTPQQTPPTKPQAHSNKAYTADTDNQDTSAQSHEEVGNFSRLLFSERVHVHVSVDMVGDDCKGVLFVFVSALLLPSCRFSAWGRGYCCYFLSFPSGFTVERWIDRGWMSCE
jgi:hypothetical protein